MNTTPELRPGLSLSTLQDRRDYLSGLIRNIDVQLTKLEKRKGSLNKHELKEFDRLKERFARSVGELNAITAEIANRRNGEENGH